MGPRMKEKELRLALVCYGGVSLVLYMHGVIKEILKLSRASKAYRSISKSERQESQSFEAVNGNDRRRYDTQEVHFSLLRSIGVTLNLRVIVEQAPRPAASAALFWRAHPPTKDDGAVRSPQGKARRR